MRTRSEAAWTTYVSTRGPSRHWRDRSRPVVLARLVGITVLLGVSAVAAPAYLVAHDVATYGYRDDGGWARLHTFDDALMVPLVAVVVPLLTTSGLLWRWGHGRWALLLACLAVAGGSLVVFGLGLMRLSGMVEPLPASEVSRAACSLVSLMAVGAVSALAARWWRWWRWWR